MSKDTSIGGSGRCDDPVERGWAEAIKAAAEEAR